MTSEMFKEPPSLKELVSKLILTTHVPGRHAARNALAHIDNARKIKDIDPTMAAFRALTGIEEAATAIFHALKRQKYNNAQFLKKERHFHKTAVYPFFQAIGSLLATFDIRTQIVCDTTKQHPKLEIHFPNHSNEGAFSQEFPLDFKITKNSELYDFSEQITQLVSERNAKSFCQHSNDLANVRNKLLYSSNEGIPMAQITEDDLKIKEAIIINFLVIYLLITQYDKQQSFIQQALDVFVNILNLSDKICTQQRH